ncbi:hypothetical protein MSAN_02337200 [Mycena sanguinolenta]|uniref:Wax synthase domain-containing protein n=1 Tax=Mycena sanguinolenta TaxID=230812 RepID=A0A8H6X664_9AGAR|nr:hypothetical protein MSAN_02337200 [Mycena sanguinolenta]
MTPYFMSLSTGHPTLDYCLGNAWFPYLFAASDYILLTNVQRQLRVVKPAWHGLRATLGKSSSPPSTPSGAFVRSQVIQAVFFAALCEAVNYLNMHDLSLYAGGPSLAACGWLRRYLVVWACSSVPMAAVSMCNHALSAAFSVGTGSSGPEDWPPWVYHARLECTQLLGPRLAPDHASCGPSPHTANLWLTVEFSVFTPGSGSAASAYRQPYIAFLISGIMHYLPEYMALRHWGGGALLFFLMQAVAISFEECVQGVGRRLGLSASWRWKVVGYLWVWSWFAFCLPVWQDPPLHKGIFEELRYSVIVLLRRRQHFKVSSS